MTPDTQKYQIARTARVVHPEDLKKLRNKYGESARIFGQRFGIGRSQLKHYEGGSRTITKRIAKIFFELKKEAPGYNGNNNNTEREIKIEADFELPEEFKIMTRPRPCRGHKKLFVFRNSRQVYCGKECRKIYLRKQRASRNRNTPPGKGKNNETMPNMQKGNRRNIQHSRKNQKILLKRM